jgi:uncharacterized protein YfaS (alpha-2-macroglobulin family)
VPAEHLGAAEGATIEMLVPDEAIAYTLFVAGTLKLDEVGPTGTDVRLARRLETLDGKPLAGPVRVGEVVAVRLSLELKQAQEYLLVEDRRPAGAEFADERLDGPRPAHVEFRDDRVCAFFRRLEAGWHELVYYLRAESAGASLILPGCAYPMYADRLRGETGADRLEVRGP